MALNTPSAALASVCLAAAAAGGYFVARSSENTAPPVAVVEAPVSAASPGEAAVPAIAPAADSGNDAANAAAAGARSVSRTDRRVAAVAERPEKAARASSDVPVSSEARPNPEAAAHATPASGGTVAAHSQTPAGEVHPEAPLPSAATPAVSEIASTWSGPALPDARELVVAPDSVIGLRMETTVSSESAAVEDRVEARVVRDVFVDGDSAIAAGSRLIGSVTAVDRGGKFKERARLGIRFHTLVMSDGTEYPISTEAIYRYGDAVANKSATKIGGGAVAGAILGAIMGGSKGAAIGATSGAGAGTAVVMAGDRSEAVFPAGTELTARILAPIAITLED